LKVLFVNNYGKMIGGAENYLKEIISNLVASGVDTLLFTTDLKPKREILVRGAHTISTSYNPMNRIFNPKVYFEFKRVVKDFSPDIVHANQTLDILSPSWMHNLKVPLVATIHDHQIACPRTFRFHYKKKVVCKFLFSKRCLRTGCLGTAEYEFHRLRLKTAKELFKRVDEFIAPSEYMANNLRKIGFENIQVHPNPIEISRWGHDGQKVKGTRKKENLILCVGKFLRLKGFDVAIKAMPMVLKKLPEAKLYFVGAGKEGVELKRIAKEIGCQNSIKFIGWVANEDLSEYYRRAKVVVVSSVFPENCSMVMLEALASGTPVVTTRLGGNPEVIRDRSMGALVEPNDPEALAEAMVSYLQSDEGEPGPFSMRESLLPPEYHMDHYIKELLSLYGDVIAARGYSSSPQEHPVGDVSLPRFKYDRDGAFCLSVDFELLWAWRNARSYPKIDMGKRARENLPRILGSFLHHHIPVTWFTVGHLFLESCSRGPPDNNENEEVPHPDMPRPQGHYENAYWRWYGKDWYELDPCTNHEKDPSWYAPDFIKKILDHQRTDGIGFEFGCHTFSHVDLCDANCDNELAMKEIEACKEAMSRFDLAPFSFAFPGNIGGNLKALEDSDIRAYRFPAARPSLPIKDHHGLWNVPHSLFLSTKMNAPKKAIDQIKYAMDNNLLCHLTMHPPEMDSRRVESILDPILEYATNMRDKERLWIASVEEIASYYEAKNAVRVSITNNSKKKKRGDGGHASTTDQMVLSVSIDDSFNPDAFPKAEVTYKVKIPNGLRPISISVNDKEKKMDDKDCRMSSKDGSHLVLTTSPEPGTIKIRLQ